MDSVFGVFYEPAAYDAGKGGGGAGAGEPDELPEVMPELLARRLAARESKDWATADAVRMSAVYLASFIGGATATGSIVAFGKLQVLGCALLCGAALCYAVLLFAVVCCGLLWFSLCCAVL